MTDTDLKQIVDAWELVAIRVLPDGSVLGLGRLIFTWALYFGLSENEWKVRYCFQDLVLANGAFRDADGVNFEPEGYIARRD